MLNRIAIVGRLTRDPETRTTNTGKTFVNFSVAVNKTFKGKEGEPDADFFNCKAWGKTAEYVGNYLTKGRMVSVDGRMESRRYEKDGESKLFWEINADNVHALDRPRDDAPQETSRRTQSAPASNSSDEYDPFADE